MGLVLNWSLYTAGKQELFRATNQFQPSTSQATHHKEMQHQKLPSKIGWWRQTSTKR